MPISHICDLLGSPHTEIFRSLHPREQKKLVGVFTFFNGALEKKLEWCDQKNRIRSDDGSIWQNTNSCTSALSNVLTHNFFNF